jgi:hypothetical protein
MEELIMKLLENVNEILAGVPLAFQDIPENKRDRVLIVALHCCLNGPVGVNKNTVFPKVGELKIKDLVNCSNKSWKGFCFEVAKVLQKNSPDIKCNQKLQHGKFWPMQ